LNRGETIKLRDLNAAFNNGKTISLAYFEAALLVEHLSEVYGQAGINKLVRIYSQGLDTDAALKAALDTDFDRLQTTFDAFNDRMFGTLRPALRAGTKDSELQGYAAPGVARLRDGESAKLCRADGARPRAPKGTAR